MTRRITVLTMILAAALPSIAAAQGKPAAARPAEAAQAPVPVMDEQNARQTRDRVHEILEQYPPSVGQVLRLDPTLLSKPDYMAAYPTLAGYVAQHPEVAHNPGFFFGGTFSAQYEDGRSHAIRAVQDVMEGLEVLIGIVTAILTLAWLIRAGIDHRRWLRATKIQTDAHNKIVDRLSSNEDLLAYMQSPSGQRFLTASLGGPSGSQAAPAIVGAPFNRILWSVQAGIVLAAAGFGL